MINFYGNDKIYHRTNKINFLFFNENQQLINKITLYEKMLSHLEELSRFPGKNIEHERTTIIFVHQKSNIALLFVESKNYHWFHVGLLKSNKFNVLISNIMFGDVNFIKRYELNWNLITLYCSKKDFINLLNNFLNYCNSFILLQKLM